MRILYAGFDGLGIDVFQMPEFKTFKWVRNHGMWGTAVPKIAHTFPSWTSINTGLTIAVHGVDNSWQKWYRTELTSKYKYIWDYAHDDLGMSCGVLTFPVTFPPREWDDGWFVCGYPAGYDNPNAVYYYPKNLKFPKDFMADWVNYVIETWSKPLGRRPAQLTPMKGMETAQKLIWFERKKLGFLRNHSRRVDFLAVQIPSIDRIGHEMIKPEMKGEDQRAPLPAVWAWIDEALRWLIDFQEPDYILIASDHGMHVELHTYEGTWALVGPGVKKNTRVDLDNWRILPTFLDAVGLGDLIPEMELSSSALVRDTAVDDRLRALGYLE